MQGGRSRSRPRANELELRVSELESQVLVQRELITFLIEQQERERDRLQQQITDIYDRLDRSYERTKRALMRLVLFLSRELDPRHIIADLDGSYVALPDAPSHW